MSMRPSLLNKPCCLFLGIFYRVEIFTYLIDIFLFPSVNILIHIPIFLKYCLHKLAKKITKKIFARFLPPLRDESLKILKGLSATIIAMTTAKILSIFLKSKGIEKKVPTTATGIEIGNHFIFRF
jgi:hypothetical protein